MSFLSFIHDLFSSASDLRWLRTPPTRVIAEMPPVKPPRPPEPQPSCFAKGVARSLIDERDQWEVFTVTEAHLPSWGGSWEGIVGLRHSTTRVAITIVVYTYSPYYDGLKRLRDWTYGWVGRVMEPADVLLIAATLTAHPVGPLVALIEVEREAERAAAGPTPEAEAHFSSLGCPPPSP